MKNRFTYNELEFMSKLIEEGINEKYNEIVVMRESDGYAAEYLLKDMNKLLHLGNKINAIIYRKDKHKYHVVKHIRRISDTTTTGELVMYLQKFLRYHIVPKKIDSDLPF